LSRIKRLSSVAYLSKRNRLYLADKPTAKNATAVAYANLFMEILLCLEMNDNFQQTVADIK